ncbi:peptide chain release factor N(5)-glutamine methyltransferase [Flavobacterium sp.]|jgi:release factor glutamine methyltransferase|uniref:peptide chain release factor N(5)-glutamine methyltransferase n=1 Tax=Flavobacterium sp. TaxID=239 RepID=UPI0037BE5A03
MLLKSYKTKFFQELSSLYDEKEIESFFYLILENFHQIKRIDLALNPQMRMNDKQLLHWESILSDLKKQKPIQYILGETEFYGLPFLVNENTLIPRPETEELVELIIKQNSKSEIPPEPKVNGAKLNSKLKILDIGTGSGSIAIALKKDLPNSEVFAIDISEEALETAKKNAQINQVEIHFIQADILKINNLEQLPSSNSQLPTSNSQLPTSNFQLPTSNSQLPTTFDIIVSNPPYVRILEKQEINPNVLEYEPHLALFVEDEDALLFYRKIAQLALKSLTPNGKLYFEINQYLGIETLELIKSFGFKNVVLHKDIYGNDRMIEGTS